MYMPDMVNGKSLGLSGVKHHLVYYTCIFYGAIYILVPDAQCLPTCLIMYNTDSPRCIIDLSLQTINIDTLCQLVAECASLDAAFGSLSLFSQMRQAVMSETV